MISKTLQRYQSLTQPVRNLIWLMWVSSFVGGIGGIFLSLFVFMQSESILMLALYTGCGFVGVVLGFTGWGYLLSRWQWGMRWNFLRTFAVSFIGFLVLLVGQDNMVALLLFALINGLAVGIFWLSMHAYEVTLTKNDRDRDFYSSMVSSGQSLIKIVAPLISTVSFYLSVEVFEADTFMLLFWILLISHVLYLPFLFRLPEFRPQKVSWSEITEILTHKKYREVRHYQWVSALVWPAWEVIITVVALLSLKTVINIGILETLIGIASVLATVAIAHIRHENNRLVIMKWSLIPALFGYGLLFFYSVSPIIYIIFSLIIVMIDPIFRVSEHMLDLRSMEITSKKNNAYPGMLAREINLSIGRVITLLFLSIVFFITKDQTLTIYCGLAWIICGNTLHYVMGKKMVESQK